jgi:hypothetical protein
MILAFELTMPQRNSWNGRWSGEDRRYIITKTFSASQADKANEIIKQGSYYYNWGDGWGAAIDVSLVDAKEAAKLRKKSAGFCGYDWMVNTIIQYGKPMADHEVKKFLEIGKQEQTV